LLKNLLRSPLFWLFALMLIAAVGGYVLFGLADDPDETRQVRIAVTADVTGEGQPVLPFAALDPALTDILLHADPLANPNLLAFSAANVPPIGAYLPAENPEGIQYELRPELASTSLPNIDASLLDMFGMPIESDAVGEVELLEYTADGCAPSGLPSSGVLTQRFYSLHTGIDIGVPLGSPVVATHSGTVIFAGWNTYGYGYLVVLQNGTYITYYGHLTNFNVKEGDQVGQGSLLAWSGSTGNSTGPHIHYETRINDAPVDPLTFGARGLGTC
jgi:murein DD-endopeptidase MepM/ murein hydrolase activator NlpD